MIKSFSGQVVFCFAILRAISAYVGENWLSQYTFETTFAEEAVDWGPPVKREPAINVDMVNISQIENK